MEVIDPAALSARQRYRLTTSLVVPRPIGWISTRSTSGRSNLAPFSFFNALSSSPMLVGASIGQGRRGAKDTLVNVRETGVFVVNLVTERHLEAMVRTAGERPAGVSEFEVAGLEALEGTEVDAPLVADGIAAFECRLFRDVDLDPAPNALLIGQVVAVHLGPGLAVDRERYHVDIESIRPVGRLGLDEYTLLGEVRRVPRPRVE